MDFRKSEGIFLVAVTQPGDASTSSGDFQQNIQIIFSQYDNQLRKEKCMTGVKEALLRGEGCHRAIGDMMKLWSTKKERLN